jgi:hypothetical protein
MQRPALNFHSSRCLFAQNYAGSASGEWSQEKSGYIWWRGRIRVRISSFYIFSEAGVYAYEHGVYSKIYKNAASTVPIRLS